MNLHLTLAQQSDLPFIVAVYNQAVATRLATADLEPITVASRSNWFEEHQDPQRPLWIIKEANTSVGWACLSNFYGRPAYQQTVEISIYIDSAFQGKKLGSATLKLVIEQAAALNITTLLAFIFSHNYPSIALFEKAGFEVWGKLPTVALMDDTLRDVTLLGKKINIAAK
jgi:L-amino acid N-acyltransferase YncA